jgi:hypothetical protein
VSARVPLLSDAGRVSTYPLLELSAHCVFKASRMRKQYFTYNEARKNRLIDIASTSPDCTIHPVSTRTDVYPDTPDHRCLRAPTPLWMICRTKHATNETAESRVTKFKVVKKKGNVASIHDITLQHVELRKALEAVTRIKKDEFNELIESMFTNSYASITYKRTKISVTGSRSCSLVFDECESEYFPGIYRVGFVMLADESKSYCSIIDRLPTILQPYIRETSTCVDTKVLHSLLFSNPYLYHLVSHGKPVVSTTVRHLACVVSGLHGVSQRIGREQNALVRSKDSMHKAIRLRRQLIVLRLICCEALDRKQHLLSLAEFWAVEGVVEFDRDWDSSWYSALVGTCDRVLSRFY